MQYIVAVLILLSLALPDEIRAYVIAALAGLEVIICLYLKEQSDARIRSLEKELGYVNTSHRSVSQLIGSYRRAGRHAQPHR